MTKYKEYKKLDFPAFEQEILKFWADEKIIEKSVANRKDAKPFVFYEGPPSANGMPGIHHVMSRAIKDIFCRYNTLKGFQVKRKAGWDTHGLPVELQVEKAMGITKEDIGKTISVEDYNEACRKDVMKYTDVWNELTTRIGYWVDLNDPYITYENNYIESLWWCLKQLHNKGYLYKGYTIQPYSPAAGTGLSSHELNQPGTYKDVKDMTAVAMFKIVDSDFLTNLSVAERSRSYFLAWTTTPWTLPSNTALAVGAKIDYVLVKTINQFSHELVNVILAKNLVGKYFKPEQADLKFEDYKAGDKLVPYQILAEYKGKDLAGIKYEQLLPFVQVNDGKSFEVITGDFVTIEDGTGIVHIAPSFGADDFRVAKQNGIGSLTLVDKRGKFLPEINDDLFLYGEEFVKEAYLNDAEKEAALALQKDKLQGFIKDTSKLSYLSVDERITLKLQHENKLFKKEKYDHTYPHCWRTDKPILYYPLESWFIKTTAVKDKLVENNAKINWKPASTGTGRFGNWLENLVDWNLSRSRYWGTPLPIWSNTSEMNFSENDKYVCVGSKKEFLEKGWYLITDNCFDELNNIPISTGEQLRNYLFRSEVEISENEFNVFENFPDRIKQLIIDNKIIETNESIIEKLDLHKPQVDRLVFIGKKSQDFLFRQADLIDVWFDSGAMPYAQWNFMGKDSTPEAKAQFESSYPADYIAEGVDQTRGWFFTLHALAVLLNESSEEIKAFNEKTGNPGIAFKNVIANGLVLDKNGQKMSKRLGNVVDPFTTIAKYGADATRWYMISNNDPWDNLKFDLEGIGESQRKFFGTLYNTYSFFAIYANIDGFVYDDNNIVAVKDRTELDRWIISKLNSLIKLVSEKMDDYDPTPAARAIEEFVGDHLSNWYVRLSRRRFWKGEMNDEKKAAYETLYESLETVSQLMSSVAPFFADWLYRNLNESLLESGKNTLQSVHLTNLKIADTNLIDTVLEEQMDYAQRISSLVLSIRKKENIKVRQPLQRILIPVVDQRIKDEITHVKDLILAEVNVKELEYIDAIDKSIKPNFKTLGKKVGAKMKDVAAAITAFDQNKIQELEKNGTINLELEGEIFEILLADVEVLSKEITGFKVANEGKITVALDIEMDEALMNEGIAREIISKLQTLRKESGLAVMDKINVQIADNLYTNASLSVYNSYICSEILANSIQVVENVVDGTEIEVNENLVKVKIIKA